jgi:hypothetical protein
VLGRYSGNGIAYHKVDLHNMGGRSALYGTRLELGQALKPGEPGYDQDKEIYRSGLPPQLQHLWVRYAPQHAGSGGRMPPRFPTDTYAPQHAGSGDYLWISPGSGNGASVIRKTACLWFRLSVSTGRPWRGKVVPDFEVRKFSIINLDKVQSGPYNGQHRQGL